MSGWKDSDSRNASATSSENVSTSESVMRIFGFQGESVSSQRRFSWLGIGEKPKDPEDLSAISSTNDLIAALRRACELRKGKSDDSLLSILLNLIFAVF